MQDTKHLSAERQLVFNLYNEGKTIREIAVALKISTQRVYQQLKHLGLQPPTKREAS